MLLLLLISRAYCILFFDRSYFKVSVKIMAIMLFIDYYMEINIVLIQQGTKFDLLKDIYNILSSFFIEILIYFSGKIISINLNFFSFIVQNNLIRARNEREINNIKEVLNFKINMRKRANIFNFIFFVILVLISLLYLISIPVKGSALYDILTLIQFTVTLSLIVYDFYPKKLPQNYKMKFADLIRGMPEEFLNEYLFKFGDNNIIDKIDYNFNIKKETPIIILNPYQLLCNDNLKNLPKNENKDEENNKYENINHDIINSFLKKGQIGYLNVIE